MKRAFISVSDKTNIVTLAQSLVSHQVLLIASNGTAAFLRAQGISVTSISDYLDTQPILGGRVKTLDPAIFGGILADRNNPEHMRELEQLAIDLIDFVIVDLYAFADNNSNEAMAIEHIDIGGVALVRAAAKNYQHCTVICNVGHYGDFIEELQFNDGNTRIDFRRKMAAYAFLKCSQYDAEIHQWFTSAPVESRIIINQTLNLAYGENPHQQAGFYNQGLDRPSFEQIQGRALSYNNLLDLDAGIRLVIEFQDTACMVIKHTNPCGAALGNSPSLAIQRAMQADLKSAFGGIVVLNDIFDGQCARFINDYFVEVIAAPDFTEDALAILSQKPRCRIIRYDKSNLSKQSVKSVLNGFLIQEFDTFDITSVELDIQTVQKPDAALEDIKFANTIVKHTKSNAIVIAKDGQTLSISGGFVNRVDAVLWALEKAKSKNLTHAVLASDGFFPFADSIELLANTNIKTVIQPGGSIRDKEVIDACDRHRISMLTCGKRCFKH